ESDTITANNTGLGVSFVSQGGLILLVTQNEVATAPLQETLESSGLKVELRKPQEIPRSSIGFSAFDAVILADIPRWSIDDLQEQNLYTFVHDVGGGLIITGGPNSFGAGGWIGSKLEQAMPLKCEPPQTRQLPQGALALIMHSCEMPEGNYWGQRMASAAIESLSELDYIGIIEYDWNGGYGTLNNSGWTLPMQLAGDKVAAMDAINSLVFGDMQDFESPMQLALDGLKDLSAAQRHVIIITDGDPAGPSQGLLEAYRSAEVTVSTVMVGGHGSAMDQQKMQGIATVTGGRFYMVNDPNLLPSIFIKEAQLNSRSLMQEGNTWDVKIQQSISGPVSEIQSVPQVNGYIVTGSKGGLAQTPWVVPVVDGDDPLLAWWHFGLGKSVAFTSDLGDRWATQWPNWSAFQEFWEATARWAMRGASPPNMMVMSKIEGGRGIVDIEAVDDEASFLNFMQSKAVVINPAGEAQPLTLQQTGPGRYHAEFDAEEAGAWLVNIAFQDAKGEMTGRIPTAIAVPYAQEYASTSANGALLHNLANSTGGRILSLSDVEFIDLFDGDNLEVPQSPQPIWDLLAILAASILIIDVAIRRLWIDKKSMQSMLAPVGKVSSVSVDALRKVHKSVERNVTTAEETKSEAVSLKEEEPSPTKKKIENRDDNLSQLLKNKRKRSGEGDDV
ncbi:MAG TPA: VWA domain-containing protein, partial [Phycisphaerales bacterium]|nr:VWA domain-containing protein [Phycisphaerales bacterium]